MMNEPKILGAIGAAPHAARRRLRCSQYHGTRLQRRGHDAVDHSPREGGPRQHFPRNSAIDGVGDTEAGVTVAGND